MRRHQASMNRGRWLLFTHQAGEAWKCAKSSVHRSVNARCDCHPSRPLSYLDISGSQAAVRRRLTAYDRTAGPQDGRINIGHDASVSTAAVSHSSAHVAVWTRLSGKLSHTRSPGLDGIPHTLTRAAILLFTGTKRWSGTCSSIHLRS